MAKGGWVKDNRKLKGDGLQAYLEELEETTTASPTFDTRANGMTSCLARLAYVSRRS